MSKPRLFAGSRRLVAWFIVATCIPALSLAWLGWEVIRQERAAARERQQELREQAADVATTALQRTVAELHERMATLSTGNTPASDAVPAGAAFMSFRGDGVVQRAGLLLPFVPSTDQPVRSLSAAISEAEALEFRRHDSDKAINLLIPLVKSPDRSEQAAAWLALARNYRKLGRLTEGLDAFDRLIALGDVPIDGTPAAVIGHQGRARLFEDAKQQTELTREAGLLKRDLLEGRWLLTRSQYQFAIDQVNEWLEEPPLASEDPERLAVADAAGLVWEEWRHGRSGEVSSDRRQTLWVDSRSVLVLTRGGSDKLSVLLVGPSILDKAWKTALLMQNITRAVDLALTDAEGHSVIGHPDLAPGRQSVRTPSTTKLPWTVHAITTADANSSMSRSGRLMVLALAMMMLVVMAGGYFINRAMANDLAVAKLQSDFIAAVSHEFRTPLTTIRQLAEMLARSRVSTSERRHQFYDVLLRESDRLQRLVESLLNFAQLEAGQLQYHFEDVDAVELIRNIADDFRQDVGARGYQIEFRHSDGAAPIRADGTLLARVFWNLLDNAVKYSPDHDTVRVEVAGEDKQVLIRVRDSGVGIPPSEQVAIFGKFVRGATAKNAAIKGTGIGLAMAHEIVAAHGGTIQVDSEVGKGSTFTVVLPRLDADRRREADQTAHSGRRQVREAEPRNLEPRA